MPPADLRRPVTAILAGSRKRPTRRMQLVQVQKPTRADKEEWVIGAVVGFAPVLLPPAAPPSGAAAPSPSQPATQGAASPWDPVGLRRLAAQLRETLPGKRRRLTVSELMDLFAKGAEAAEASGGGESGPPPPAALVPRIFIPSLPTLLSRTSDRTRTLLPSVDQLAPLAEAAAAGVGGSDAARTAHPDLGAAEVTALVVEGSKRLWSAYLPLQWAGGDEWEPLDKPKLGAQRHPSPLNQLSMILYILACTVLS